MVTRKKFNQKIFDETDAAARGAVSRYIESNGLYVVDNTEIYGPDLVVYTGYTPSYYAEVEIKRVWRSTQQEFPWPTIQLPERKAKFLGLGLPIEFWILREDLDRALVIEGTVVQMSPLVEVPNKYVASGELFYQVPVSECAHVVLSEVE